MVTYADKPWLKHYDQGVPHSLQPYPDHGLHHFLTEFTKKNPNRLMTITSARLPLLGRQSLELTYKDVDDASDALASAMIDLGLKKGDRVAIVMMNSAQFIISFFAVLKAGGVVAATNPTYPADKMKHQIADSGSKIILTVSMFYNLVTSIQAGTSAEHIIVTNYKEYLPPAARVLFTLAKEKKDGHKIEKRPQDHWFQDLLAKYKGKKPNVTVTKDDLAIFQYTGGTTGVSKAAMATHGALVANTLMARAWLFGSGAKDSNQAVMFLGAIPMFHAFGLVIVVSCSVTIGGSIALVPNPRDMVDVLDVLTTYKCGIFPGVPAMYNAINNHPKVKSGEFDITSVQSCFSGSAPLAPAVKEEFERLSGGVIVEGYGMSEAPTATSANPLHGANKIGSVGIPFPDMEVKIVSLEEPDQEMPLGEVGELVMHGPTLMRGYHNMPTETQNVLREHADGKLWLHSGDIAYMDDDGYIFIVDRKKDMALIGGFNVYPRVIEDALMEHPGILEVGVAAIPHPEKAGQEALKAWVVLQPEAANTTEKDIIEFARTKLAPYEVPTRIAFADALPRTTVGKVLRRELAQLDLDTHSK